MNTGFLQCLFFFFFFALVLSLFSSSCDFISNVPTYLETKRGSILYVFTHRAQGKTIVHFTYTPHFALHLGVSYKVHVFRTKALPISVKSILPLMVF
jgi:hypothetical protein